MPTRIVNNVARLKVKLDNNAGVALRLALEDIHRIATPVTPMDTGNLRQQIQKQIESNKQGYIQWNANYALYQENPPRKFNYTTPGTGPHFAEKAVKHVAENFSDYMRRAKVI